MVNFAKSLLFSPVILKGKQFTLQHNSSLSARNLTEGAKTHYGFETVSETEKARRVHAVFENVASSYDLMNDFMSGGVHRLWKDAFMSKLAPVPGTRLLDVAGGTGDIAFRFLKYLQVPARKELVTEVKPDPVEEELRMHTKAGEIEREATQEEPESFVMVCDINEAMLQVGQSRAKEIGYVDKRHIDWLVGDAQNLPLKDESFDAYTIAFGIRNVVDVQMALEEAYRVLRPGGRFMCLEFSHVPNPLLRSLYDMYSFNVIPPMGQLVAQDYKSYKYLVESIRRFPDQETFKSMIEQAGFRQVTYENFTFGVVAVHSGFKL